MATAFWVEGLKSVTCKEEQRDKKYQNKYGGARNMFSTKTNQPFLSDVPCGIWVAELGSLSSGAKMAMKIFVKRLFTIFGTNALFLRVIANLQI